MILRVGPDAPCQRRLARASEQPGGGAHLGDRPSSLASPSGWPLGGAQSGAPSSAMAADADSGDR